MFITYAILPKAEKKSICLLWDSDFWAIESLLAAYYSEIVTNGSKILVLSAGISSFVNSFCPLASDLLTASAFANVLKRVLQP